MCMRKHRQKGRAPAKINFFRPEFGLFLSPAGFRLHWGDNAEEQSPDMGDILLHGVARAWSRGEMRRTKPTVVPWEDARAQWAARASRCVTAINSEHNAKGLCAELLDRLRTCMVNRGERLEK